MTVHEIQKVDLASFCYKNKERYPFLLESVNHNENNRYSLLFAFPKESIVLDNLSDFDFLKKLDSRCIQNNTDSELPFTGGWFVYLSYELIGEIEPVLKPANHESNLPIAYAVKVPTVIYTDHKIGKTFLYDEEDNQSRISQILTDINTLESAPISQLREKFEKKRKRSLLRGLKAA